MFFRNFFRFRQQEATAKPPSGYKDLRLNKTTGKLVLVDSDGTETVFATTSQSDGTIKSADVSDAISTGAQTADVLVKTGVLGTVKAPYLGIVSGAYTSTFEPAGNTANRAVSVPDLAGVLAIAPSYADESAANTALAANVVYYNVATGKFQITTA